MNVKRTTVSKIITRYKETGSVESAKRNVFSPRKLNQAQMNNIKSWIDENCTLSLQQISNRVMEEFLISFPKSTISKIMNEFNYFLKIRNVYQKKRNFAETVEKRFVYAQKFLLLQSRYSENGFIFIDEIGFNVSMRASRGRSLVGNPAIKSVPALRTRNFSICCAINRGWRYSLLIFCNCIQLVKILHFLK
jgi:transposase